MTNKGRPSGRPFLHRAKHRALGAQRRWSALQKDSFELIGRRIRSILPPLLHSPTLRAPRFSRGSASLNFTTSSFPSRGVRCKWQSVGPHLTFWLPNPTEGQRCTLASLKGVLRAIQRISFDWGWLSCTACRSLMVRRSSSDRVPPGWGSRDWPFSK